MSLHVTSVSLTRQGVWARRDWHLFLTVPPVSTKKHLVPVTSFTFHMLLCLEGQRLPDSLGMEVGGIRDGLLPSLTASRLGPGVLHPDDGQAHLRGVKCPAPPANLKVY
jgi:hypothetical protein